MGMNILLWNADIIRLVQALSQDFRYLKSSLGDESEETIAAGDI